MHRGTHHGHAMAAHQHDGLIAHQPRNAVPFFIAMHRLIAFIIINRAVIQQQVVVMRKRKFSALHHGKRCQMPWMDMDHAGRCRIGEVNARVDVKGNLTQFAAAAQHAPFQITNNQIRCLQFLEQVTSRIDQEARFCLIRQHEAIVIADMLIPAEPGANAEHGGHVAAEFPFACLCPAIAQFFDDRGHLNPLEPIPAPSLAQIRRA